MKAAWSLTLSSIVLSCGGSTFVGTSPDGGDASVGSGGSAGAGGNATGGSSGSGGPGGRGGSSTGGSVGAGGSGIGTGGQGGIPGSDAGACVPSCGVGFICCGSTCVNPNNDIFNCGSCNHQCGGASPFCDRGTCGTPPCSSGAPSCEGSAGVCCGAECCTGGEICCQIMQGIEITRCANPVNGTCPVGCPLCVCASPGTPVAAPEGVRPIESLHTGDLVYSVDRGELVAVPIEATQRIAVVQHHVTRVVLEDGVVLEISGRHPTADGRTFADLRTGDQLDGVNIRDVSSVPYAHAFTYDILPASDTGTYFAGGVLVGSTMKKNPVGVYGITMPLSQ